MPPSILVIDDVEGDRKLAALALGDTAVRVAASLEAGLAALRESPPAVVLVDLGLPGMEAAEAIAAVAGPAHHRGVAVIAYTSRDPKDWHASAFDAGADGYVQKRGQTVDELRVELQLEIRRALRQRGFQARSGLLVHEEIGALRSLIDERLPPNLPALIGSAVSDAIAARLAPAPAAAPADALPEEGGETEGSGPIAAWRALPPGVRKGAWGGLVAAFATFIAWLSQYLPGAGSGGAAP